MTVLHACTVCGAVSDRKRCPTHRPKDDRPNSAARGYGARWRATRARFLQRHPECANQFCDRDATEVHHLDGEGPLGPLGHDERNLLALCASCHGKVTAWMQPGGWNGKARQA